ncbi:uncharacterized protein JCM15063_002034 [Sporobolomyces koalae]|uniref:uncharacterized protein n=1 Tax=Sporobolomyces koalae TaxID=500713 RepID=UPI00316F2FEE
MQSSTRLLRTSVLRTSSRPTSAATSPASWSSAPPSTSRFPVSNLRSISYSPISWAREAGSNNPFEDGPTQFQQEHAPLFERVMQHPEVMDSIENMAKLTQQKTGVNLQAGDKPSLSMMYTLARDPELRQAAERLMAALKSAGIEVDPKEAFKALQMMGKDFGGMGGLGGFHEGVNKGGKGEGEGNEGGNQK